MPTNELAAATTWITDYLAGKHGYLCKLEYAEPKPSEPTISGVYAVCGPAGVYVGESVDCWNRGTLELAARLGLECGIMREMPGAGQGERIIAEAEIAELFVSRGMAVISNYLGKRLQNTAMS